MFSNYKESKPEINFNVEFRKYIYGARVSMYMYREDDQGA